MYNGNNDNYDMFTIINVITTFKEINLHSYLLENCRKKQCKN